MTTIMNWRTGSRRRAAFALSPRSSPPCKPKFPGEMIEVELDREDGAYVYELKILRSDGKIQEIEVDAATGQITKIEDDD